MEMLPATPSGAQAYQLSIPLSRQNFGMGILFVGLPALEQTF